MASIGCQQPQVSVAETETGLLMNRSQRHLVRPAPAPADGGGGEMAQDKHFGI